MLKRNSKYDKWCVADTETLKEFYDVKQYNYDKDVINYQTSSNYKGRKIWLISFYFSKYNKEQSVVYDVYHNQSQIIDLICEWGLIYFHNLSYDGNFILKLLQKQGWKQRKELISLKCDWYDYMMIGSKIYKIEIHKDNKITTIIDSNNFIRESVKDIPMKYGLTDLAKTWKGRGYDEKWMYEKVLFNKKSKDYDDFNNYCINDSLIVYKALNLLFDFVKEHIGEQWNIKKYITVSSFAYDVYKSMNEYTNNYLNLKTNNFETMDNYYLLRSLYKGGFCDVNDSYAFKEFTNNDNLHSYDLNSAYPAILDDTVLPCSFVNEQGLEFVTNIIIFNVVDKLEAKTNLRFLFNDCFKLRLDENSHPKGFDKGSVFCLYEQEFEWTRKYYKGEIFIVKKIPVYGCKFDLGSYVKKFYQMKKDFKQQKNKGFETLTKLFINSVTGKFGQRPTYKNRVYFNKDNEEVIYQLDNELLKYGNYQRIATKVRLHNSNDKSFYINKKYFDEDTINLDINTEINNFLLISYITMLTRCKIIKAIDEIGVDKWVYSDTDSIKLIGELSYNVGLNLGQYKNEGQAEVAIFYHPKAYFWNNEFTFAGVSKDKTKDIDYKEIKDGFIIESGKKKPSGVIDGIELEDVNYMIGE